MLFTSLQITEPEINVTGNGVSIADGDATPSLIDYTDFGSADVASGSVDRVFAVANLGNATLNLTGTPRVQISGVHAADFSVTVQPSSPVAPSGSTAFTVHFDPSATGLRSATVSIANDDANENPYNFAIQGTGTAPFATADVGGDAEICAGQSTTIQAGLTGTAPWNLTWSDGFVQNGVASSPATRSVSPAATTIYTLAAFSDNNGSGTTGGSATITVHPNPAADAGSNQSIDPGGSVQIGGSPTANGGQAPFSYSWSPATGLDDATAANPNASPASTTQYTVIITDANGCTAQDQVTVSVGTALVDINSVIDELTAYVEALNISSSIQRAITRRLDLAASRFGSGYSTSSVISSLNYVINYVQYQSGGGIPAAEAAYIVAQVESLASALNGGTVACCQVQASAAPLASPGLLVAPEGFRLEVYPNPFSRQATIRFYLPRAGQASLGIFNLQGQLVRRLESARLDAGSHEQAWNGSADDGQALAPGIYLLRLSVADAVLVEKVSLIR